MGQTSKNIVSVSDRIARQRASLAARRDAASDEERNERKKSVQLSAKINIMPFKSEAQRRYLWAKEPKIAEAWAHGKSSVTGKKEGKAKNTGLPMHKRSSYNTKSTAKNSWGKKSY